MKSSLIQHQQNGSAGVPACVNVHEQVTRAIYDRHFVLLVFHYLVLIDKVVTQYRRQPSVVDDTLIIV